MNQTYPKELTDLNKTNPRDLIGRTEDLQHLRQLLSEEKQITLVNGMGGIGKTTLAEAYVFENYDQYDHIAWITNNSEAISDDFVQHRDLLKNLDLHNAGLEPPQLFEEMMRRMRNFSTKNNLLVIDNAVKSAITPFLKKLLSPPGWHLLVTSRERISGMKQKDLSFLSPEEANALFKKHCSLIKDEDFITEITAKVEYHTLTIEILAKTTARMHLTPEQVRNALKTDAETDLDDVKRSEGATIKKVTSFLASIFELSDLSEDEIWMLKQFCCLPPDFFELEFLKDLIEPKVKKKNHKIFFQKIRDFFKNSKEGSLYESRINFITLLNSLTNKGWLLKSGNRRGWKMHRIIWEAVSQKENIEVSNVETILKRITDNIYIDYSKDNPIEKIQWIPFGQSILEVFKNSEDILIASLLVELGTAVAEIGDYENAKRHYLRALKLFRAFFGENHSHTAILYSNLAYIFRKLKDYDSAKYYLEKALNLAIQNFGEDHPKTGIRLSRLGKILHAIGDYDSAKYYLEKALNLAIQNFGEDHPKTAKRYSSLGLLLSDIGDFVAAKSFLKKALLSDEKNFGENHPSTANAYLNFGSFLKDLKDLEVAKHYLEKALIFFKKNFGENHPSTIFCYSELGELLHELEDLTGAKPYLKKVMHFFEKKFGEDHPKTAKCYSELGILFKDLKNFSSAKYYLEKALDSNEKNFGEAHSETASLCSILSFIALNLENLEECLKYSKKSLRIFEAIFPEDHPQVQNAKEVLEVLKSNLNSK